MKIINSKSGQVLLSTVVTGLVIALIAAGLMRLVFQRYTASAKVAVQTENTRCLQMAVGQFMSFWDRTNPNTGVVNQVCTSNTGVFNCSGPGVANGHCHCKCTFSSAYLPIGSAPTAGLTVLVSHGTGGPWPPCTFQVISNDIMNPPAGCQ